VKPAPLITLVDCYMERVNPNPNPNPPPPPSTTNGTTAPPGPKVRLLPVRVVHAVP
jgi:hypothetical protein